MSEEQQITQPDAAPRLYAVFSAEGYPEGFYSSKVHAAIPDRAIEISEEQWREFVDNQGTRKWQDGAVVPCDPPAPVLTWDDIQGQAQRLLAESDYTMLPDAPISPEKKNEWIAYRQALRAVNTAFQSPADVVWPQKPT